MNEDDWIFGGRFTFEDKNNKEIDNKNVNKRFNKLNVKLKQIREENQKETDKLTLNYYNKIDFSQLNKINNEKDNDVNDIEDKYDLDDSDKEEEYTKDYLYNFDTVLNTFKNLNIVSEGINDINDMKKNSYYNNLLNDFNKFYSKCEELKEDSISKMNKIMKDNINNTCSICYQKLENIEDMIVTKCKHVFHKICLNIWFEKKSKCPLCRRFIYLNQKKD
jgi:hypothetical protein